MMNIEEFFELSAGKWFCHRTIHNLAVKKSEDGKSNLWIEILATDHPEVAQLCQKYNIAANSAASSVRVTWHDQMKSEKDKQTSILVSVPDESNPHEGRLLQTSNHGKQAATGRYKIGNDEAVTLTIETETMSSEERFWYASPNLRMRVSVLKYADGLSTTSFASEIRMGGGAPAQKTSEAAKSAS